MVSLDVFYLTMCDHEYRFVDLFWLIENEARTLFSLQGSEAFLLLFDIYDLYQEVYESVEDERLLYILNLQPRYRHKTLDGEIVILREFTGHNPMFLFSVLNLLDHIICTVAHIKLGCLEEECALCRYREINSCDEQDICFMNHSEHDFLVMDKKDITHILIVSQEISKMVDAVRNLNVLLDESISTTFDQEGAIRTFLICMSSCKFEDLRQESEMATKYLEIYERHRSNKSLLDDIKNSIIRIRESLSSTMMFKNRYKGLD